MKIVIALVVPASSQAISVKLPQVPLYTTYPMLLLALFISMVVYISVAVNWYHASSLVPLIQEALPKPLLPLLIENEVVVQDVLDVIDVAEAQSAPWLIELKLKRKLKIKKL